MSEPLDKILSPDREIAPSTEQVTEQPQERTETAAPATESQSQEDESGRVDTVPHQALHAEKQKVKRYTQAWEDTQRELADVKRMIAQEREERERQRQQAQPQADWFADPDAAFRQNIQQHFAPVLQQQAQALQETREFMSKQFAAQKYGEEAISAAYKALEQRLQTDSSAGVLYQQIMAQPDPWGTLAQWHKRETFLAEAGTDPDAYRAKVEAEVLAKMNGGNGQPAPQQQRTMPSNFAGMRSVAGRSGPAYAGPQSIGSIFEMKRQPAR